MENIFPYSVRYFRSVKSGEESARRNDELRYLLSLDVEAGRIVGETGVSGLRLDFNSGLRLQVPEGNWHIIIHDYDSGLLLYDDTVSTCTIISWEKYYIRWEVEVYRDSRKVFAHILDFSGQKVRIVCHTGRLGDALFFLPYVQWFHDFYQVETTYFVFPHLRELAQYLLPDIPFQERCDASTYATYYLTPAIDFPGASPFDGRTIPLHHIGQVILGLPRAAPSVASY